VKDPDPYLSALNVSLACAVDPSENALIDAQHRVSINWETYYVSSDDALEQFLAAPHKYAGLVTDPVERTRFRPDGNSPTREHDGRRFYFETADAASRFDKDPGMYAEPMLGMVEMK
jgi:YHS domain-containing protein